MKSRLEEITSVNAILATRYHTYGDLLRAAMQVAKINHHDTLHYAFQHAWCPVCDGAIRLELNKPAQISGKASDFTCEQIQAMRRKR